MSIISKIQLKWIGEDDIQKISFGEIVSHKLLSSRGLKPELGGLFDPRIFGPFVNFQCYCGKYKGRENKGKKCERCEVLIVEKNIQRWRMGHISLVSPVVNMIIFKNISPILSKIIGLSAKDLEKIIYFESYIVINEGFSKVVSKRQIIEKKIDYDLINEIFVEIILEGEKDKENRLVNDKVISQAKKFKKELEEKKDVPEISLYIEDYVSFLREFWNIEILNGVDAFSRLISEIDIDKEINKILKKKMDKKSSDIYRFFLDIKKNNINLNSMIMNKILVIPCGLRPITRLVDNDDLIAASQINVLYRKIILINQRLENYINLGKKIRIFFREILDNEMRSLQKAVDNLIIGSNSTGSFDQNNNIKSLSQSLSGKDGILRRDSLGKRVDYSARSVIVPNPNLTLDQIGIPVRMAINLFEFVIVGKILERGIVSTVKEAEKMISNDDSIVFSILNDEIVKNWNVLVNRAPSLHRPSIQGFHISLTSGSSIELHPLETPPFNADHDGDNVNIFAPQTDVECNEIEDLVLSIHHTVDPKNGFLINVPNQEIILGIYYLSIEKKDKGIILFDTISDIEKSFHCGKITLNDLITIPANLVDRSLVNNINNDNEGNLFLVTTYGKIIFNRILPSDFPYYLNDLKDFNIYYDSSLNINKRLFRIDKIENIWKDLSIIPSWRKKDIIYFLNDFVKFSSKKEIVKFLDGLKKLGFDYSTYSGISISPFELSNPFSEGEKEEEIKKTRKKVNEVENYYLQGLYSKIERKQRIIKLWEDCKNELQDKLIKFLEMDENSSFYHIWKSEARATSENLTQIFAMRGLTTNYLGQIIEFPVISSVWGGLSPFELIISAYGVIKGMVDIALRTAEAGYLTRRLVEANQDVIVREDDCGTEDSFGIEIGENFSFENDLLYGCYLSEDVLLDGELILKKGSLILNKEIFLIKDKKVNLVFVRTPLVCKSIRGVCQKCYGTDLSKPGKDVSIGLPVGIIAAQSLGEPGTQLTMRTFKTGGFKEGADIVRGLPRVKQILDNIKPNKSEEAILARDDGEIIDINEEEIKQSTSLSDKLLIYHLKKEKNIILCSVGDKVKKGDILMEGKVDLEKYLSIVGKEKCQRYIINEVEKVYLEQGITINKKHFHIISRQMLSKVIIEDSGDTGYLPGDLLNYHSVLAANEENIKNEKKPCSYKMVISSLKDLASFSTSFLSDISFQRTIWNLVHDSIKYPVDYLNSFKSNLIVGNILPING